MALARMRQPFPHRRMPLAGFARRRLVIGLALLAVALVASAVFFARGRGYKSWLAHKFLGAPAPYAHRPGVTATRPQPFDSTFPLDGFVAADVDLPNPGSAIDGKTVSTAAVKLYREADRREVPAMVNTSGAGDAIVLRPLDPLEPNTQYTFEVNGGLRDTAGAPFKYFTTRFTTANGAESTSLPIAFERVALPAAEGEMFTAVTFGPDRRLYAATMDGRIIRFDVQSDGTLAAPLTILTLHKANSGPRLVTGICFDPSSTPERPVLWASHGMLAFKEAVDWSGRITRLSGPGLEEWKDVVVGLPRGVRDHLNNQPAFGPDGALYFSQASDTAMGAPDSKWGFREEHLLSAAILRLDVAKLSAPGAVLPLDVKTEEGGTYDPFAPGAPLTIYATGVRNAYDILWHSNGSLYAPMNGSAAGGNTPAPQPGAKAKDGRDCHAVPALADVRQTLDDFLFRVEPGGYYGHPNPRRGQFVLNGGNPTAAADPAEVLAYPVGTRPDEHWRPPTYSFGKNLSPTGAIEYQNAAAFNGLLRGKMLVCRYSGGDDIIILGFGPDGEVVESITGVEGMTRLMDPLDVAEDVATGNLYVSEFQPKRLTLLRPKRGDAALSQRVFRQTHSHAAATARGQ